MQIARGINFKKWRISIGWFAALCLAVVSALSFSGYQTLAEESTWYPEGGKDISKATTIKSFTFNAVGNDGKQLDIKQGVEETDKYSNYLTKSLLKTYVATIGLSIDLGDEWFSDGMYTYLSIGYPSDYTYEDGEEIKRVAETAFVNTDWADLKDDKGNKIGKWRNAGGLQLVFDNIGNAVKVVNVTLSLNYNIVSSIIYGQDRVYDLEIGGSKFSYKVAGEMPRAYKDHHAKTTNGAPTNNHISWKIFMGQPLLYALANSDGKKDTAVEANMKTVLIRDDEIESKTYPTLNFTYKLPVPVNLKDGKATKISSAEAIYSWSYFDEDGEKTMAKVEYRKGESYDTFLKRVMSKPMQYGVYEFGDRDNDSLNEYGVIVYYGQLGKDTPQITSIDKNFASKAANLVVEKLYNNGNSREQTEAWFNKIYGLNSDLGGRAYDVAVLIRTTYNTALAQEKIENTAMVAFDGKTQDWTASGFLQPPNGSAIPERGNIVVSKFDEASTDKNLIPLTGVTVTLQRRDDSSGVWRDMKTLVTDEKGQAIFTQVGGGIYRVIEKIAPEGYSLVLSPGYDSEAKGVISGEVRMSNATTDAQGNIVYGEGSAVVMKNKRLEYTGQLNIVTTKTVNGEKPGDGEVFRFELIAEESVPMPEKIITESDKDGKVVFGPIEYSKSNLGKTYTYKIREIDIPDGYLAQNGEVEFTVTVADQNKNGNLELNGVEYDGLIPVDLWTDGGVNNEKEILPPTTPPVEEVPPAQQVKAPSSGATDVFGTIFTALFGSASLGYGLRRLGFF